MNIKKYQDSIKRSLNEKEIGITLTEGNNQIKKIIDKAVKESCPKIIIQKKINKPWWNMELNKLHLELGKFKKKIRKIRTIKENSINPEEIRKLEEEEENILKEKQEKQEKYGKLKRKRKRESWAEFTSGFKHMNDTEKLSRILKKSNPHFLQTLKKEDGTYTSSKEETLEELLRIHFPDQDTVEQRGNEVDLQGLPSEKKEVEDFITIDKIKASFKSFKPHKSPGTDGIKPIMLHNLPREMLEDIRQLYISSILTGTLPKAWEEAKVVFIPKPGKDDYTIPNSFRPISLTSFLLKGLERLILWFFEMKNKDNKIWHKQIHAYRQGRSTETALHQALHSLEKGYNKKEKVVALSLDVNAAFNNTNISSLVNAMAETGMNKEICHWLQTMLSTRRATAKNGESSRTKHVQRGTPQGSVISPILFNLLMNNIIKKFENKFRDIEIFNYADDLLIILKGKKIMPILKTLEMGVKWLNEELKNNGLSFSASKSNIMLLEKNKHSKFKPLNEEKDKKGNIIQQGNGVKIDGKAIKWVKELKYLGIWIKNKLNWKTHLDYAIKKAYAVLAMCKKVIFPNYGAEPRMIKWMYEQLVRPVITYGCSIWIKAIDFKKNVKKLEQVQRTACLYGTGALKYTMTQSMELISDITPIHLQIKEKSMKTCLRMRKDNTWDNVVDHRPLWAQEEELIIPGHKQYIDQMIEELQIPNELIDNENTNHIIDDIHYKIIIDEEKGKTYSNVTPECPKALNIFTDGSKLNDGSTGAGYIIKTKKKSLRHQEHLHLGKDPTVFQAELQAILAATKYLNNMKVDSKVINFYSDSKSSLETLQQIVQKGKLENEVKLELNKLARKNKVTLNWIKAHIGLRGNEIADRLAKMGAENILDNKTIILPLGRNYKDKIIEDWRDRKHQEEWVKLTHTGKGRITKIFFPNVTSRR